MPTLSSWSHSRLDTFEKCKFRAFLKYVKKLPEPERPLPAGKTEHANDRGTRVHLNGELFVKGQAKLGPELRKHYEEEYFRLQEMFKAKKVLIEDEWALTREWERCDWRAKEAWLRLKLDVMVFLSAREAIVIDLKTGRRDGNQIKHAEQVQLYQLVAFLLFPDLDIVHVELWYSDIDDFHTQTYTRDQGLRFLKKFEMRGDKITTYDFKGDEKIEANPSIFTCRYCMYGPRGSKDCSRGIA